MCVLLTSISSCFCGSLNFEQLERIYNLMTAAKVAQEPVDAVLNLWGATWNGLVGKYQHFQSELRSEIDRVLNVQQSRGVEDIPQLNRERIDALFNDYFISFTDTGSEFCRALEQTLQRNEQSHQRNSFSTEHRPNDVEMHLHSNSVDIDLSEHGVEGQMDDTQSDSGNRYDCRECGSTFKMEHELTAHCHRVHSLDPYQCPKCNKQFKRKSHFSLHQKYSAQCRVDVDIDVVVPSHSEPAQSSHQCDICQRSFSSMPSWRGHRPRCMAKHRKRRKQRKPPNNAESTNDDEAHSVNSEPVDSSHSEPNDSSHSETSHRCDLCGRSFPSMPSWRGHRGHCIRKMHKIKTPQSTKRHNTRSKSPSKLTSFQCTECGRDFRWKSWLKRHLKSHHSVTDSESDDDAECDDEEMGSDSNSNFDSNSNLKSQSKRRVFPCSNCDDTFLSKRDLNGHWLAVHLSDDEDDPSIQSPVHAVKSRRRTLKESTTNRATAPSTESRKESAFRCTECGQEMSSKRSLMNHELLHREERPFECTLCDSAFPVEDRLNTHYLNVHGVRPHRCQRCNGQFAKKMELRHHRCRGVDRGESVGVEEAVSMDESNGSESTLNGVNESADEPVGAMERIRNLYKRTMNVIPETYSMQMMAERLGLEIEVFSRWMEGQEESAVVDMVQVDRLRALCRSIKVNLESKVFLTQSRGDSKSLQMASMLSQIGCLDVELDQMQSELVLKESIESVFKQQKS